MWVRRRERPERERPQVPVQVQQRELLRTSPLAQAQVFAHQR
jgi:hypothetical protein